MEQAGVVERTSPARRGLPISVRASASGRALMDEVTPHVLAAFSPRALGLDEDASRRLNADLHTVLGCARPLTHGPRLHVVPPAS